MSRPADRKSPPERRLLTLKHAADYMDFSPGKMRQMVYEGVIPYIQDGRGGKFWLDREDLDRWIERSKRRERN